MTGLIIAAGMGTRLANLSDSKPLIKVNGIPLIERVILSLSAAGIEKIFVVTGYNADKIRSYIDSAGNLDNIDIDYIQNDEWEKANGISVLKAKDHIAGNFILTMSDHLFDPNIVTDLMKQDLLPGQAMLAVDYNTGSDSLVDIDDVTKVWSKDSWIINIGKELTDYNCYDTGMFLCSPGLFEAIEQSTLKYNDTSLSGGMRELASSGKARVFDIDGRFWIDVDDETALAKAEKFYTG